MTKEECESMWIELKKIHKKLVLLNHSANGDQLQAPIKRAERAIDKAMDILKPVIEGKK